MGWRWGQREEREKKKKRGERQEKFFQRKTQGLSLTLTSDRALIKPPPRAVGRGISAAPDGPGQSLGPAPRRGGRILWAARSMPLPLTSRHEGGWGPVRGWLLRSPRGRGGWTKVDGAPEETPHLCGSVQQGPGETPKPTSDNKCPAVGRQQQHQKGL